jgi:hypothetical protein
MKVGWLSRHQWTEDQKKDLAKGLGIKEGEIELSQEAATFNSSKEIVSMIKEKNYKEAVVVLPINLIGDLLKEGIQPLRAFMIRKLNEDGTVTFNHSHFERVIKVEVETKRLGE